MREGNQSQSIPYSYDNQGNLLKDDQAEYRYNSFNRVERVRMANGDTQVNRYDAEGLRYELEENGKLVQFLYSHQEVVAETKEDGAVVRYIRGYDLVSSDSVHAKTYYQTFPDQREGTFHYACDEMGSISFVADLNNREILNEYRYDAFGNTIYENEQVSNRFRYTGQQYDGVTGQYYLRARYYNPIIGRFTQEDSYYGDGLNLYAYCANHPVGYYDPTGNSCDQKIHDMFMEKKGMTDADAWEAAHKYQDARAQGKTASEAYLEATGKHPLKPETLVGKDTYGPHYDEAVRLHQQDPEFFSDPDASTIVQNRELRRMRDEYDQLVADGLLEKGHHVQGLAMGGDNVSGNIAYTGESTIKRSQLTQDQISRYGDMVNNSEFKMAKITEAVGGEVTRNNVSYNLGLNDRHTAATNFQNKVFRWQRSVGLRKK